jgi:hypothetical protein
MHSASFKHLLFKHELSPKILKLKILKLINKFKVSKLPKIQNDNATKTTPIRSINIKKALFFRTLTKKYNKNEFEKPSFF